MGEQEIGLPLPASLGEAGMCVCVLKVSCLVLFKLPPPAQDIWGTIRKPRELTAPDNRLSTCFLPFRVFQCLLVFPVFFSYKREHLGGMEALQHGRIRKSLNLLFSREFYTIFFSSTLINR